LRALKQGITININDAMKYLIAHDQVRSNTPTIQTIQVVGEKQKVDSRGKVKHNEENDQLFVKTVMKVGERG